MDLQKLMDAMGKVEQRARSGYHLTLGQLIARLDAIKGSQPVALTGAISGYPGEAMSYRGFYDDLSFEPSDKPVTRTKFLALCRSSLNKSFVGYKGGDFVMDENTPLWISAYGRASGIAVMDLIEDKDRIFLVTKMVAHP